MDVHDDMNFYVLHDKFIAEPNYKNEVLIIDRITEAISLQAKTDQIPSGAAISRRICGILGTIKLLGGPYLIAITHRIFVGLLNGHPIWQLAGYELIPYLPGVSHLTEEQKVQNELYLGMVRQTLDTPSYYFSYTSDLTLTQQRLKALPEDATEKLGLYERADKRFVWNDFILRSFMRQDLRRYALPVILGFVSINNVNIAGESFFWSLVTRRSTQRAGTRLFCRGVDEHGYVANFVETEQIVEYSGDVVSFVQTRGSIPLYWRQTPNLKYKPPPEVVPGRDHLGAFAKHFDAQLRHYGQQVLVNLIDQRGAEDVLEKAYHSLVQQLNNPDVRYEAFDFHAECRKMQYDRLHILINRVAHKQDEFGVHHARRDGAVVATQTGVFRTNCIDCLDRTNVVQSMLAKRSLVQVLAKLSILKPHQSLEVATPSFETLFKNVWADNADLISTQYSGTGALKTDFTRTGKRTKWGLLRDGVNSLTRYYKNNFNDGFRQDAFDLVLGNYVVQDGEGRNVPSPLKSAKGWRYLTFPSVLIFAVAMFAASTVLPHEFGTENLLFLMFWGAMTGVSVAGIFKYNTEFVDWPKLLPPVTQNPMHRQD